MNTLPDYLEPGLKFISIGLNPSPISVEAGYYFANPHNRFWKALNRSRIVDEQLPPGEPSVRALFRKYQIGFTDLVKKPTRMGNALRAGDYREGAPILKEKILDYHPVIAWFHGKLTYDNYLKYAEHKKIEHFKWGLQKNSIGNTSVFVTPNPSPANAKYSLDDLTRYYNDMVSYQIRELFGL